MNKITIHIIALSALGEGLSGGDRIFIEFSRNWSKKFPVNIYVWEEGLEMCKREHLKGDNLKIKLIRVGNLSKFGFIFTYVYRIYLGFSLGFLLKIGKNDFIYSASEFWMDSLSAFILKVRYPNIKWVAAWYQTAPNPLKGFTEGKRQNAYKLKALFYWLAQKIIKPIISRFADFVLVNNINEQKQFIRQNKKGKVISVLGAVRIDEVINYRRHHPKPAKKKFLAVFQGRFHPQKGVVELIDIWKEVTKKIPDAKLAMIGGGPLVNDVKKRINDLNLKKNVELFGYLHDGNKKYSIFQSSKIVVHPAFYDSGGMAVTEAMAFGLPCVGFELSSYPYYFPMGILRAPIGDLKKFSEIIIRLSYDKSLYLKKASQVKDIIFKNFSWEKRAHEIFKSLKIKNDS